MEVRSAINKTDVECTLAVVLMDLQIIGALQDFNATIFKAVSRYDIGQSCSVVSFSLELAGWLPMRSGCWWWFVTMRVCMSMYVFMTV